MASMLRSKRWSGKVRLHFFRAAGMSVLLALAVCGTALCQQVQVSGTVSSTKGVQLRGVTVHLRGTETSTVTAADGKDSLTVMVSFPPRWTVTPRSCPPFVEETERESTRLDS